MKKNHLFSLMNLVALLSLLVTSCSGQSNSTIEGNNSASDKKTMAEKIDEIVRLYSYYGGFNGSVLVAQEGKVVYKRGFGLANMEWDIPNQADTKFQIASVTKQFTAMLIMQLVAENKLDLHKPISTYLPEYPIEKGSKITLHQLLSHTSGTPSVKSREKAFLPKEMVEQFADEPLKFTPGERFSYSNSGYTLLGYLIETVTGEKYEEVLQNKIFKPLHMDNSGFYWHRPLIKNLSSGYNKWYGDYFDVDRSDESSAYSAGGIYSTVEDLFLWDQALNTEALLPKKYLDLIFTKHSSDPEYGGHYGYGWEFINKPVGNTGEMVETIGHSGSIGGFRALQTKILSSNSTIIFLNNTSSAYLISMTTAITGILHDKPYDFPKKPAAQFMLEVIEKEGIEKGIVFYKEHMDLADYYISEEELIIAGYRFLHGGNAADAAAIFKLSTEVFPDRYNPYDSYAEALMSLGKKDEAIKNYEKSLAINPDNTNAKNMLVEIEKDDL